MNVSVSFLTVDQDESPSHLTGKFIIGVAAHYAELCPEPTRSLIQQIQSVWTKQSCLHSGVQIECAKPSWFDYIIFLYSEVKQLAYISVVLCCFYLAAYSNKQTSSVVSSCTGQTLQRIKNCISQTVEYLKVETQALLTNYCNDLKQLYVIALVLSVKINCLNQMNVYLK